MKLLTAFHERAVVEGSGCDVNMYMDQMEIMESCIHLCRLIIDIHYTQSINSGFIADVSTFVSFNE